MKIKNQVCTLEQAKRLKELGIEPEQDALLIWCRYPAEIKFVLVFRASFGMPAEYFYAFTVAELGVMLGKKANNCYQITPKMFSNGLANQPTQETQAQCYAALLIYCLEDGKLTAEECNQRLNAT